MTLAAGSIAFTGFNADGNDSLSFVALEDLASGTVIYFGDNEWNGLAIGAGGAFNTGEGAISLTLTANVAAGTIVTLNDLSVAARNSNFGTVAGSVALGNSNETVYAYLGSSATTPTTFLAAITNSTFSVADGQLAGTGLTAGTDALALSPGSPDVAIFTGARTGQASFAAYRSFINNAANWITQDGSGDQSIDGIGPDVPFSTTAFTVSGGGATVSINDVAITEGDAGTSLLTFTVTRTDSSAAFSVDFATSDGTAQAPGDYVAAAGTIDFTAGGSLTQTVSVTINGDTSGEANETFNVILSNIVNTIGTTTIADGQGLGTISNDDVGITAINAIQGAAHISPLLGLTVTTTGIVTAVDSNGFYLQTRDPEIDASIATSEAIFVFTSSAPSVAIGDAVNVTGTVGEFTPGGASTGNLSTTQLTSPSTTILSSGNALPTAIRLGAGGRVLPTENIDNDGLASFDPTTDGVDFYESLEAMRVTVPTPRAVSATNGFGEIYTVADNGAGATGLSARGTIVTRGSVGDGLNVTNTGAGSDYNPERIQIDADSTVTPGGTPLVDVGAVLNDITGVIGYNFGNFEVIPTVAITVLTQSILTAETTALNGAGSVLTIASYNVLNLDPNDADGDKDVADGRFTAIANQIVFNLNTPDIIALQEVQDNSGSANDGTVSASLTLQTLVNAINAAGGPAYSFVDNSFITNNTNGGQPGGNIRVAYLYDASRVSLVGTSTTPNAATDFAGSRPPLVANFSFGGDAFTVIDNHFSSKGGSSPLYGTTQPSTNGGAADRLVQATNVANFVTSLGASAKVVVLGDLNEFTNEESLAPLSAAGLTPMSLTLAATERYSFIFEGNAQELDQVYLSGNLTTAATFDIVHTNTEFASTAASASDHDPSVLALNFAAPAQSIGGIIVYNEAASLAGNVATPVASNDLVLVRLGSIQGVPAGAESIAFEAGKAYSSNLNANTVDVTAVSAAGALTSEAPIALSGLTQYRPGGVNGVAVKNGIIAVGYENVTAGAPGYVALFDAATKTLIKTIQVGVLPDHLAFSPDGLKLLVANEGETVSTTNNPVGSISIISLAGGAANASVTNTIAFDALNGFEATLRTRGLATLNGQTAAADIEPEYITVSADGSRAYVTLQEVNAVAVIDLTNPAADRPLSIQPLGSIDRNLPGNALDTSDQDAAIALRNVNIFSLPQPDAIASYSVGGVTYFVTANEGDARVVFTDSVRLGSAGYVLDPTLFPNAAALKANANLGRLNVLTNVGDTDGDGDFDKIFTLGGRSISIFRQEADGSITKVRETGGEFEAIIARDFPAIFNSNQSTAGSSFDTRSDDKGPEPEGVSIGTVNGRVYAFVGLERVGGQMVYDITDPANAVFVTYRPQTAQDIGPETSAFVAASDSPTGQALLIAAQETTNTVTLYSIQTQSAGDDTIIGGNDSESWSGRGGNDVIRGNGGNDAIDGGIGSDTAVFAGGWVGYDVTVDSLTVVDIDAGNGNDGTDTLTSVEFFSFNGVVVAAADAVNDAPIGINDTNAGDALAEDGDSSASGNVLANDIDADAALGLGETRTVTGARAGTEAAGGALAAIAGATIIDGVFGQLTINADGSYSYALDNSRAVTQALNAGQTAIESFTYEVKDAHGLADTAQINLSISGLNDGYRLQLLHLSDGEAGTLAPQTAPNLAALVDKFEDAFANSITLAGGDTFLPGPFLAAGTDPLIVPILNALTGSTIGAGGAAPGVVDTAIHNLIGVEASGIGNHEWDLGSNVYLSSLTGGGFSGAQYVSISANLVLAPAGFTADPLNSRFTQTVGVGGLEEASSLKARIAPSAVITEGGEKIGLVGATTQILEAISSPTGAEILGFGFGPGANGETNNMALLAAQLQPVINDLLAQGVNKIVLLSHLQQIQFEQQLAPLLTGVDIILAAGSNTRLGDADDVAVAFPGHAADFANTYPIVTAGADGKPTVIVNTDNEYTYLGRLVVDFDNNGEILLSSIAENVGINGAYASTAANVAAAWGVSEADLATTAFAAGTRGGSVKTLTEAVNNVIIAKDGNIFGYSNVYLEGERIQVRNQETNLGNVSADANADVARDALGLTAFNAVVSIKNGGGIRAQIGTIINNPDGTVTKVAPAVDGEVSQLDVENALRFNNRLMVFDTTAQGLLNILNGPTALAPNNGGFIQIGGVSFSYDPTRPVGSRVQDVVLINDFGQITAVIADNGVISADAPALITAVVLNFTAQGGDSYPIKANGENFRFLLNDGTVSAPVSEALNFTDAAVVPANAIGEQQAFAEYFQERYATPGTAYDTADTEQAQDLRIQNQVARTDTVLAADYFLNGTNADNSIVGNDDANLLQGLGGNDAINGLGGSDTAAFAGIWAGYEVTNGGATVADIDAGNGNDGTDTLTSVEFLRFNGVTVAAADAVNDAPIGVNDNNAGDAITEDGDSSAAGNVLTNDTDADAALGLGETKTVTGARAGTEAAGGALVAVAGATVINGIYGQLTINADGSYGYALDNSRAATQALLAGQSVIESFTYQVADAHGLVDTAQLDLAIAGAYDAGDAITGTAGSETINGTGVGETITGLAGNDVINGLGGNDILNGGLGADRLNGGEGSDTATYATAASAISASLVSNSGSFGEALGDRFSGIDNLTGSDFDDVLVGNKHANVLDGGDGNDTIRGGGGADVMIGGDGDDSFIVTGTQLFASIDGGEGYDSIIAGANGTRIAVGNITGIEAINGGGFANVTINGTAGIDVVDYSGLDLSGIAAINGNGGNDDITGSNNADVINGGADNDRLVGEDGDDVITGGLGVDTLGGGLGADRFIFLNTARPSINDTILDFDEAEGDLIDLSLLDASTRQGGNNAFSFIGDAAFSRSAGQLRFSTLDGSVLVQGDVNGDGVADFTITLNDNTAVTAAAFIL